MATASAPLQAGTGLTLGHVLSIGDARPQLGNRAGVPFVVSGCWFHLSLLTCGDLDEARLLCNPV